MKNKINISMQICKLIAAIFVVFIHITFPGRYGKLVACIARFAVPIFFAISGYFSYKIDSDKIKKRIIHIFKLNIIAVFIYLVIGVLEIIFVDKGNVIRYLLSVFSTENIAQWLIINEIPFSGHLWYLSAILMIYIFLWVYVKFSNKKSIDYKQLYMIGIFLLLINIFAGSVANASGESFPYTMYRNAIFWGIPMFCLGMFIKQYYERIIKSFNLSTLKIILIIVLGLIFSVIEYFGIGVVEMPLGMIFTVIGLLLLCIKHPNYNLIKTKFILLTLDKLSLIIYIIHPAIIRLLIRFFKLNFSASIYPLIILSISMFLGVLYTTIIFWFKKNKTVK